MRTGRISRLKDLGMGGSIVLVEVVVNVGMMDGWMNSFIDFLI